MELRQLRYFVKAVECKSLGKAALELDVGVSALSQQLSKLESELCVRLLSRNSLGVVPTQAGTAFLHHAQLTLRQAENAIQAAQRDRMSGYVSLGLAPTTASILALPLIAALRERYPDIQLHIVEMLSGYLARQLNARQLDLAVLFQADAARRWSLIPLLDERLFFMQSYHQPWLVPEQNICLKDLSEVPLVLPSLNHGLRSGLAAAFERENCSLKIIMEIDGLSTLMAVVRSGHAATIQPGAVVNNLGSSELKAVEIVNDHVLRRNLLASLSDDELSPAALAVRVTLVDVVKELVKNKSWPGASLLDQKIIAIN